MKSDEFTMWRVHCKPIHVLQPFQSSFLDSKFQFLLCCRFHDLLILSFQEMPSICRWNLWCSASNIFLFCDKERPQYRAESIVDVTRDSYSPHCESQSETVRLPSCWVCSSKLASVFQITLLALLILMWQSLPHSQLLLTVTKLPR